MAKKDTIAALKALGITPDESKTDAILKQELFDAKASSDTALPPAAAEAGTPAAPSITAPAKSTDGPIVVKYRDHIGQPTEREFSLEVHGKDFSKLADEFKATNADKIIAE